MAADLRPVIIAGPTASGKSSLALAIAERDGGRVINADALQVYSCWRVLTARPDAEACARAPHRLYGHVAADAEYSVGHWLREIAAELDAARAAGARPVIVGGTGLYLTALTTGLDSVPPIPPEVRDRSDAALRAGRIDALLADLARGDPATLDRIDRANPRRVQRAWDVLTATGRGLSAWREVKAAPVLPAAEAVRVTLIPDKALLNNNIFTRFKEMVEAGGLDEAAAFRDAGLSIDLPAGRALGASQLIDCLNGEIALETAIESAVIATRQYAKRQRTWLRNRMADWTALDPAGDLPAQIPWR